MSWENWINEHENESKPLNITEPIHSTLEEIDKHIFSRAHLLNGQIRGPINKIGREENFTLILMTLASMFEDGYKLGHEDGKSNRIAEEVKQTPK
jgi:hypothetical protein